MKVRFTRYSVCICGFPILSDAIPLGTEYEVDQNSTADCTVKCGGCGKENRLTAIWVFSRAGERPGYLPRDIFEIEQPATA
jgi:hypothetical protein